MNTIKKVIIVNSIVVFCLFRISSAFAQILASPSFEDELRSFRNERKELQQLREQGRNAGGNERKKLKQVLLEPQRLHLLRIADIFIKRGENIKNRIMNNKRVYRDVESSLIAQIDDEALKLKELKMRVSKAKTAQELTRLARELKAHRKDVAKGNILRSLILINIAHFENTVIKKAEERSAMIANKVGELKNAGKAVGPLEELLIKANTTIALTKTKLTTLKDQLQKEEIVEEKLVQIKKGLSEIKGEIESAYDMFLQIASKGKSL